jgi:formate hydrogenlyase transcriptional activator
MGFAEYQKTVEGMGDILCVVDRNYRIVIANQALPNSGGLDKKEIVGRHIAEIVGAALFEESIQSNIDDCFRGTVVTNELQYEFPDHRLRDLHFTYFPIEGPAGIGRIVVAVRDLTEQRQAAEKLQESEERYRSVVAAMAEGIVVIGADGRFLASNPGAERMLGCGPEELREGSTFLKDWEPYTIHEDGTPFLADDYPASVTLRTGEPQTDVCFGLQLPGKEPRWIRISTQPLRPPGETKPYAVVASFTDVTESRHIREELKQSEEQNRLFIEHAPAALAMLDREMRYLQVSRRWCSDYKLDERGLIGKCHYDVFPEIPERWKEGHRRALAGEIVREETERFDRADGSVLWLRRKVRPWYEANGQIGGIVIFSEDITARKRAEEALRRSEADLREAQRIGRMGSYFRDFSTGAIVWSQQFYRMLGLDPSPPLRWIGEAEKYYSPASWQRVLQANEDLRRTGEPDQFEVELRRPDGTTIWAALHREPVRGSSGEIVGVRGIALDITERKRTEDALRRSEAELRQSKEELQLALQAGRTGAFELDLETGHGVFTSEVARIWGIPDNADIDLVAHCWAHTHPEDLERTKFEFARIAESGETGEMEFRVRAGGEDRWIRWRGKVIRGAGGRSRAVGVNVDITGSKRVEEALHESEERFRTLYENSTIGLYRTTPDGRILLANPSLVKMLGFSSFSELSQLNLEKAEWGFGYSRSDFKLQLETDGEVRGLETSWRNRNGTAIFIRESARAIRNPQGEIAYYEGTVEDITECKRAEAELRTASLYARSLIEASVDPLVTISRDGKITDVNEATEKATGLARERLIGSDFCDYFTDPDAARRGYRQIFAEGMVRDYPLVIRHVSGKLTDVLYNARVFKSEAGEVESVFAAARDITARKQAEELLRQSERQLKEAQRISHLGYWDYDMDTGKIVWSDETCRIYGLDPSESVLSHDRLMQLIPPEDHPAVEDALAATRSGAPYNTEHRIIRPNGEMRFIHARGDVTRNESARPRRMFGTVQDITERKHAEEALRASEAELRKSAERFRVALKNSPLTVFSQDQQLRYTWVHNPHFYHQSEMIGKTDADLFGEDAATRLTEIKEKVLSTGSPLREEVALTIEDKTYAYDISVEPLQDADGKMVGITGTAVDIARLREMADRLQDAHDKLQQQKSYLEREIRQELGFEEIVGQSPALLEVLRQVRIVAPTGSTVLLLGETGTGKELIARSLHTLSARREKSFVKLNCAAVPSGLLESELFGHEKGAFTGAVSQKLGRIELADKGTLFLDEIGELPPELQPKLLRVLQDHEFERLGSNRTLHVDVRIISASNRDLYQDVVEKRFRGDLFYRLNVFPITLPPLRERQDDIPALVRHFVRKYATRMAKVIDVIPDETLDVLSKWNWPGNIRELENMIERMVILTYGTKLAAPPSELALPQEARKKDLAGMKRDYVIRILRECNGVLSGADGAANRLGIKRTTLQSMIKRLEIDLDEFRQSGEKFGT